MIYLIIFIWILYLVYKYDIHKSIRYHNSAFWGLCIVFILLAGLRYRIGGDTLGYIESWNKYPNFWDFNWFSDIEKTKETFPQMERYPYGWFLFAMFFVSIYKHQVLMQFAVATLLNYSIFRTVKRYSTYPFITIFVYYFNYRFFEFEFEIMRESVAIAFFLLFAYDYYLTKKWIKYYLGTFLAYMIHPSAIFMFALPFFRNLKISLLKGTLFFMILPICLSIFGRIILGDLLNIFFDSDGYASAYMFSSVYREYNSNYIAMYIYQPLMIFFLVAIMYRKINNNVYIPLIFFTLFFLNLSLLYFTAMRLVNYIILPVYIGVTPLLYYLIKKYKTVIILPVLLVIYNVPTIFELQRDSEKRALYFPYQNYIFQERSAEQKNIDRYIGLKI